MLNYGGYQVVNIKAQASWLNLPRLTSYFDRVNLRDILMFSRQLALLIESGADIVTSRESI